MDIKTVELVIGEVASLVTGITALVMQIRHLISHRDH